MSDIQIINPLTFPGYDDLLLSTPGHSFFHSSAWARVLVESYGYRPLYFASVGDGRFKALMPMMEVRSFLTGVRGVSLPFSDACEPLSNGKPTFQDLMGEAIDHGRRAQWRSAEWRGTEGIKTGAAPSQSFFGHTLELGQDEARMLLSFRDSTRRNIAKARRQGVTTRIERSWAGVRDFCRLNDLTRREHGLPPQPPSFFRSLHRHVISAGNGFMALADHEGRPIAGAVFLHLGRDAVYKYGASDRAHQALRANNLVMWEGTRQCAVLGCTSLSLGRTDPGHDGLLQFKRGWGTEETRILYYRYDVTRSAFVQDSSLVNGWHTHVVRRLSLPVSRLTGALLYRHMT
jgi:hypothetical protein